MSTRIRGPSKPTIVLRSKLLLDENTQQGGRQATKQEIYEL